MASISCRHIYKIYPGNVTAVKDFNLEIADKEFIVFVGPSGCGKSTTLRMIAGLEEISKGEMYIGDRLINDVPPKDRDIAMVFQNYALYPHMTVYKNMAFGLELRKMPKDDIDKRVREAAKILEIEHLLDRKPKALSGGQRQRLALAGVLAMKPGLLLLDEPTANLDPEGVVEVHDAVKKVIEATGQTMVVVEHHIDVWLDLVDRVIVLGRPDASSPTGAVIADGKPDEVFAEMGDVLAAGGAWVPGRAIPDYSPKQESAHDAPVLSTENLSFGRGAALGVGINLDFYPGEVTALMGPNGAGKSTLALTLAGLLKPIAGKVLIADNLKPAHAGREPIDWKSKELLGRIGMVFQPGP